MDCPSHKQQGADGRTAPHLWRGPAPRTCARLGFTLIELLVVISIVSVLIAVLMPALGSARAQGRATKCLSNMREMGIALQMYAMDHDEYVPAADCPAVDVARENMWLVVLQKYSSQALIAQCPNDDTKRPFLDWGMPPEDDARWHDYRWSSYALNFCFVPSSQNAQNPDGEYSYLKRLKRPDSVIYLAEIQSGDEFDSADHIHADRWETPEAPLQEVAWDRHLKRSNYVFADGHVDTVRWQETWEWPTVNWWWPSHAPAWPPVEEPPP